MHHFLSQQTFTKQLIRILKTNLMFGPTGLQLEERSDILNSLYVMGLFRGVGALAIMVVTF